MARKSKMVSELGKRVAQLAACHGVAMSASEKDPRVVTGVKLEIAKIISGRGPGMLKDSVNASCLAVDAFVDLLEEDPPTEEGAAVVRRFLDDAETVTREYEALVRGISG